MSEHKNDKLVIKISASEKKRLMEFIEQHHINLSALVRSLLADYLNRQRGTQHD